MQLNPVMLDLIHSFIEGDLFDPSQPVFGAVVRTRETWIPAVMVELVKHFTSRGIAGTVVSYARPSSVWEDTFRKADVDITRVFLIDATEGTIHTREERALHIKPNAVTDLLVAIAQFAQSLPSEHFVIIDNLDALHVKLDAKQLLMFLRELTARGAELKLKIVLLATQNPAFEQIEHDVMPFFEKVIELG